MTAKERIFLFDTTLRDGQQTPGVDFSVEDKIVIARMLDEFGFDYVEGGYPGANPTDTAFFREKRTQRAKFVAFGMTKRAGVSASNDPGLAALVASQAEAICFVAKSWDYHVRVALGCSNEDNIESISASVAAARAAGKEAMVDCEHFFDGFKANPDYALSCARAAFEAGARWVVLCDTNGGTLPSQVRDVVENVIAAGIPGSHLGIHAHDDTGQAVANSLAAVEAGVRQIQGTLNGIGERCGNANLVSLIPSLTVKMGFDVGIGEEGLRHLRETSRMLDERLNRQPNRQQPYVGDSAFAHKGGLHVSAIEKDPRSYEHVDPSLVGNARHVVVSDQAGRSNILARFREIGFEVDPKDPKVNRLVEIVKEREFEGYAYDGAEASFELLARRTLEHVPEFFDLQRFRVMDERRFNAKGRLVTEAEATVTVLIGNETRHEVALGNGPVNAFDNALRKALVTAYPGLEKLQLVDYKVRILTPNDGTRAITRVMIESEDEDGTRWTTVGVSPNILDASVDALSDSITYKLMRAGIRPAA